MDISKFIKNKVGQIMEDRTNPVTVPEVAFGVKEIKDLSDAEKNQFGEMETPDGDIKGDHPNSKNDNKTRKEAGKINTDYYKTVGDKIKGFEDTNVTESENKYNLEDDEREMYYGSGMEGLRYDSEGTERHDEFEERNDDLSDEDETYEKLRKDGKKYSDYKYGEKLDKPEKDGKGYQLPRPIRAITDKKGLKVESYSDVPSKNIFKIKGKLINEEQVIKLANEAPKRVRVDESVFALNDGENYFRILWEGDTPIITHRKNLNEVSSEMGRMKEMFSFTPKENNKTLSESENDTFKEMFRKLKPKKDI